MRRRIVAASLLSLAFAGCGDRSEPRVTETNARLPLVQGRPGAAYFTVTAGPVPQRLIGVSSPQVERIELHDMVMDGNVMRMGPLGEANIGAGERLEFAQGGKHAMLFGIDPAVKPGGAITMTFDLHPGPDVTVEVPVEATGGE